MSNYTLSSSANVEAPRSLKDTSYVDSLVAIPIGCIDSPLSLVGSDTVRYGSKRASENNIEGAGHCKSKAVVKKSRVFSEPLR